jgi:hypothetical protein
MAGAVFGLGLETGTAAIAVSAARAAAITVAARRLAPRPGETRRWTWCQRPGDTRIASGESAKVGAGRTTPATLGKSNHKPAPRDGRVPRPGSTGRARWGTWRAGWRPELRVMLSLECPSSVVGVGAEWERRPASSTPRRRRSSATTPANPMKNVALCVEAVVVAKRGRLRPPGSEVYADLAFGPIGLTYYGLAL